MFKIYRKNGLNADLSNIENLEVQFWEEIITQFETIKIFDPFAHEWTNTVYTNHSSDDISIPISPDNSIVTK